MGLLLASAEDGRAVLAGGLPHEALLAAPKPLKEPRRAAQPTLESLDANPNDLREQLWGIVAPEGRVGDRLLEAIAPLSRLRENQQGAPPRIYRVGAKMDAHASLRFRDDVYRAEDVPDHERPRYLLVLGDLHQVSLELQQVLAHGAYVGRIHFSNGAGEPDPAGYAAYAEKVARCEKRGTDADASSDEPDALFYVALDGSKATMLAYRHLITPCVEDATAWRARGKFPAASVREIDEEAPGPDPLLRAAAGPRPSVLLSVSHGLGAPLGGWTSAAQQRARQGELQLGYGHALTAEMLANARFLPGGIWLCVACFGAGTPATSAFRTWLSLLAQEGRYARDDVDAVLSSLPLMGERPFIAALPQAALASPEGPLAVIGHVDLAWTYGFMSATNQAASRASRMLSAIKVLVNGSRAGIALDALMRAYRETNDALMATYEDEENARIRGRHNPIDPAYRAHLWMLRNDLRGYILLGDPAAHLTLRKSAAA